MQNKTLGLVLTIGALLMGCSSTGSGVGYQPIIDNQGVNMGQYQVDLNDCRMIAAQVEPAANSGMKDAAAGAVVGAAVGAIVGNRTTAMQTAGLGALAGGVSSGERAVVERNNVLRNCLRGRGYRVLN
jgi:outer membrane lipoprotein SlyB